ncbi:conserved hypothetical protein [Candidatus Terasakiella magnetica]|nr:conserved hypothetical protein [Candidatus Terasakiella magnetica]
MDLFELMSAGREEKALDRLEAILVAYRSEDEAEQGEALERATAYCEREWGGYRAGLELLARKRMVGEFSAVMLEEEAVEPGSIIRAIRTRRRRERGEYDERDDIIALYGGEQAAREPTPFERIFVTAAQAQAEDRDEMVLAVSAAHPLPTTVAEARAETVAWGERLHQRRLIFGASSPAGGLLPACVIRHGVVEELWRRDLPAADLADFTARLDYWAHYGGGDGSGYALLEADLRRITPTLGAAVPQETTKERARRLKATNPEWSLARIGKELGISRQAVHKHLKQNR